MYFPPACRVGSMLIHCCCSLVCSSILWYFICVFLVQELGAEVVRVLLRNADLFRAIAVAGAVDGEAGEEEEEEEKEGSSLKQRPASEAEAAKAKAKAAVTEEAGTVVRALSLPAPGGSGAAHGIFAGAGEMGHPREAVYVFVWSKNNFKIRMAFFVGARDGDREREATNSWGLVSVWR